MRAPIVLTLVAALMAPVASRATERSIWKPGDLIGYRAGCYDADARLWLWNHGHDNPRGRELMESGICMMFRHRQPGWLVETVGGLLYHDGKVARLWRLRMVGGGEIYVTVFDGLVN